MASERHTHKLTGCAPIPLAHYLKALGILRLVGEQADPDAQGWWSGDVFYLRTMLSKDRLRDYFLNDYRPTPVVAPWNGGSGFFPKDNQDAIHAIQNSKTARFAQYAGVIAACRDMLSKTGLTERPTDEAKVKLLTQCRNELPDDSLEWLDAAFVLTNDGPKYPPLLGTGGNDGRLDFTNNLMQRIVDVIDPETGNPTSDAASWWEEATFAGVKNDLQKNSILGQFDPGALDRPVNPWDFVLMIEGALVFAAAATKRHEASIQGLLSYPFCVRSAGIGYGSASGEDESSSRAEIWLPLWIRASTHSEIERIFSEGRAELNGRAARSGVDFARSIATLGVDRGIEEFSRLGFHARNGLAYFAVPLGRFRVRVQREVNLLDEIDDWLYAFRRAAANDNAPSRARRSLRVLERAILNLCRERGPKSFQGVVIALADCEASVALNPKWREDSYLRPIQFPSSKWLITCDDSSEEFRLAASLAGLYSKSVGGFRKHLEQVDVCGRWPEWTKDLSAHADVVWSERSLADNLLAILNRRTVRAIQAGNTTGASTLAFPGESRVNPSLGDVGLFLQDATDDGKIANLARGLSFLDWRQVERDANVQPGKSVPRPDATFALLKLCYTPHAIRETHVRLEPAIAKLATAGRVSEAIQLASRRLMGSGLPPAFSSAARSGAGSRRLAAAMLFPLGWQDIQLLAESVLCPKRVDQLM